MLKIDMHTHLLPEKLPNFAKKFGYGDFIHLIHNADGTANMMKGDKFFRRIQANCWDPALRVREYAEMGTQVQVVCTIPVMFSYWAKAADAGELAAFLNDHIAQLCHDDPQHYLGLGTLPMQDADEAIKELQRCREIGLLGVQIGSNINDKNLSEPEFFPIFEAAEALGMAILVHPWNMMGREQMEKYWLPWLVGMPAETARAAASMIFGGVLERLPGLRVCFAHAGGSLLPTLGRIEHGFNCRPDLVAIHNHVNPRQYLGDFWVDSITHDPKLLQYVLDLQGSKRVCMGSDYPFPLGDLEMGAFIEEMGLPEEAVADIFAYAALEWLGIDDSRWADSPAHKTTAKARQKP
jgi:aminocarboxymuconate-semialdehyde decarboxylase